MARGLPGKEPFHALVEDLARGVQLEDAPGNSGWLVGWLVGEGMNCERPVVLKDIVGQDFILCSCSWHEAANHLRSASGEDSSPEIPWSVTQKEAIYHFFLTQ